MALRVGCVLMAAGESRRFGGDKLAAELHGRALLERASPGRSRRRGRRPAASAWSSTTGLRTA